MASFNEDSKPAKWVEELDSQIESNQKKPLAHEAGAGARCTSVGCECSGLDLHFWRKCCKVCKCPEICHDITVDTSVKYSLALPKEDMVRKNIQQVRKFEVKQEDLTNISNITRIRKVSQGDKLVFDWVPPDLQKQEVLRYMNMLPPMSIPISNSIGAINRRLQWSKQIPDHDLDKTIAKQGAIKNNNLKRYFDFINTVRGKAVGQAEVKPIVFWYGTEGKPAPQPPSKKLVVPEKIRQMALKNPRNLAPCDLLADVCSRMEPAQTNSSSTGGAATVPINLLKTCHLVYDPKAENTCGNCKKDLETIAVVVKKRDKNFLWHPACFVCETCKELLVDLIYFCYKEKFYCLRDYVKARKIPRCNSCDELIFNDHWTMTTEHEYHVEHFCCFHCDVPLADKEYVMQFDQPWCLYCYYSEIAVTCVTCNQKVGPREPYREINDVPFHQRPECCKCEFCSKPILDDVFTNAPNTPQKVFCSKQCKANFARA